MAGIAPRAVLTQRARAEACRRVGKDAHAVAAVARDLGIGWASVMRAVHEHGTPAGRGRCSPGGGGGPWLGRDEPSQGDPPGRPDGSPVWWTWSAAGCWTWWPAVLAGIMAARAILDGARGGVGRPNGDLAKWVAASEGRQQADGGGPRRLRVTDDLASLTVHLRFPAEHWHRIRHSNLIERTFGETRRRTK